MIRQEDLQALLASLKADGPVDGVAVVVLRPAPNEPTVFHGESAFNARGQNRETPQAEDTLEACMDAISETVSSMRTALYSQRRSPRGERAAVKKIGEPS